MQRPVNFYELLWTMLLYITITEFHWILLIIIIISFPGWVILYDNAQAAAAAKKTLEEVGMNEDGTEAQDD